MLQLPFQWGKYLICKSLEKFPKTFSDSCTTLTFLFIYYFCLAQVFPEQGLREAKKEAYFCGNICRIKNLQITVNMVNTIKHGGK